MSRAQAPQDGVDLAVIGLGYVGLGLASLAARQGRMRVIGFDTASGLVQSLNAGRSHVVDVSDQQLADLIGNGFRATDDPSSLRRATTVVICVPTPLLQSGEPDLSHLVDAAETLSTQLRKGMLVVIESTTYPGTTDDLLKPLLESGGLIAGSDFSLAYSPERLNPGEQVVPLDEVPKVVGGFTDECLARACHFYERIFRSVVKASSTKVAELSKLLENTYRHVNIALVNEFAILCNELNIDVWDVVACAESKPFGFQAFRPGSGVGGHCIPIDPSYLLYKARSLGLTSRFIELAHDVNRRMPFYIASRVQRLLNTHGLPVLAARVLLLGVTYKANVPDLRETPAQPLGRELLRLGAEVSYADPFVESWQIDNRDIARVSLTASALANFDVVVLLQDHQSFDHQLISRASRRVFDTCGVLSGAAIERL